MFPGPVCVALTPARVPEIFAAASAGADCIEVRLDYLEAPEEARDVRWDRLPLPVIATCRGRERGGLFSGGLEEEVRVLGRALENGARWVDLDFRCADRLPAASVLASHHDFAGTPPDLEDLFEQILAAPAAAAKIATQVRSWSDNRRILELLAAPRPKPVVAIGMGAMGEITRILGPSRGGALTYVAAGRPSAPGQLDLGELVGAYRFRKIGRRTRLFGIVGDPVGHSASPEIHNRAFEAAGLDCVYLKLPVRDLADFFGNAGRIGLEGFSVTIPHKVGVMRFLDEITPEARAVGAVNTVWRRDGKWWGDNTDVHGIRQALAGVAGARGRVVILGTGGAARAAVAALAGAESLTLLSRSLTPGRLEWARPVEVDRIEHLDRHPADLLINATPVGMSPDIGRSPAPGPIEAETVFDMIYNPERTRLIEEAAAEGRRVVTGLAMFRAQAARQFEIWTGVPAPAEIYGVRS